MGNLSDDISSKMDQIKPSRPLSLDVSDPSVSIQGSRASLPICDEFQFDKIDPMFSDNIDLPGRFDAEIASCVIRGNMPPEIDGTFYRVACDYIYAGRNKIDPNAKRDIWINGDGAVDAWRISNGVVDFKQKFVRTPRFLIERAARKPLFGNYRNPWSGDERVANEVQSPANTHVHYWRDVLLMTKDDSPPISVDPDTLDTHGIYDFDGQLNSATFTAHPKIDAGTGELIGFGMEATGVGSNDLVYYQFDKYGKKINECWLKTPKVSWCHDFAATENWVVFMLMPFPVDVDRMKATGDTHFNYSRFESTVFGLLPRRNPKPEDIRWFTTVKNHVMAHFSNHFEDDNGIICMDIFMSDGDGLGVFLDLHPELGKPNPNRLKGKLARFKIDPHAESTELGLPEALSDVQAEMARCDDRYATRPYRHAYAASFGAYDLSGVVHVDLETGVSELWQAGDDTSVSEPCFAPRSPTAPEGDGWLIVCVRDRPSTLTYLVILDAMDVKAGPVCMVEMPIRLRVAAHGNWVNAHQFSSRKPLVDYTGVVPEILEKFATGAPKPYDAMDVRPVRTDFTYGPLGRTGT